MQLPPGTYKWSWDSVIVLAAGLTQVVEANPMRVYLGFHGTSGGPVRIRPASTLVAGLGITLSDTAIQEFYYSRHGPLCQAAFQANPTGGVQTTMGVVQVILVPGE